MLIYLRSLPTAFPSIKLVYSKEDPVELPVTIVLSQNGIRMRFDGVDQRLRLIEVLEWGKMKMEYKGVEIGYVHCALRVLMEINC